MNLFLTLVQDLARKILERIFSGIKDGYLSVTFPDGQKKCFGSKGSPRRADLTIKKNSFFNKVLFNGEIGFGESFMENGWTSSDPVNLISFFIKNLSMDEQNHVAFRHAEVILNRVFNRKHVNSIHGSLRNIMAHYDLGNDFFSCFLDKRMVYSCAFYEKADNTLEQAQLNKIHRIIEKTHIRKTDHVLEIGSGWGAFAVEAAKKTGCCVTTITLSEEQLRYVRDLVRKEHLESRVSVELVDYRKMTGSFDRIVSIEMLEAVGPEHYSLFFAAIERLLKHDGIAVLQVITTMDHHYKRYSRRMDWIQKHVFPGGHLPCVTALSDAMAKNSRLYIENLENIGPHYARTLSDWRERFTASGERLLALGYDRMFQNKWLYYFCLCEAGFAGRVINDVVLVLSRAENTEVLDVM